MAYEFNDTKHDMLISLNFESMALTHFWICLCVFEHKINLYTLYFNQINFNIYYFCLIIKLTKN